MPFHVYLLKCADGSYYAGHTDALEPRLAQHHACMGSDWTRRRLPVQLMWTDSAPTRDEALAFERRIKGWTRVKKEALIAGNWTLISHLARPPHERQPNQENQATVRPELVAGRSATVAPRPSTSLRTNGVSSGKTEK